jgi:2'-5' RNA ligase
VVVDRFTWENGDVEIIDGSEFPEVAAAAVHTGAMIALVPSDADIKRLALDGGEPAGELHLTVMYLGDAADLDPDAQAAVHAMCAELGGSVPPIVGDGFALNVFNPHTDERDTALVMGVGGDGLAELHQAVSGGVMFPVPKQHAPYVPHITLAYSDDLTMLPDLVGRLGPVTLDRLRVAFGDEVTDYPLTGEVDGSTFDVEGFAASNAGKIRWSQPGSFRRCVRAVTGEVRDPEALCATLHHRHTGKWPGQKHSMTVAAVTDGEPSPEELAAALAYEEMIAEAVPNAHFHTLMHSEGVSTGRRVQMPGSLTWRTPPIPFNWQVESGMHGGQKKVVEVGLVTDVARHGTELHGWGSLDLDNPIALEYARKLAAGWVRGVSVGMDEQPIEVEYLYSAADPDEVVQEVYLGGNVMEVTSSGGIAQESAYVEPLPALLEALAARGIEVASAAEDCGCPDAQPPVS